MQKNRGNIPRVGEAKVRKHRQRKQQMRGLFCKERRKLHFLLLTKGQKLRVMFQKLHSLVVSSYIFVITLLCFAPCYALRFVVKP